MKQRHSIFAILALIAVAASADPAKALNVPGTSDLWLAGMPDGTAIKSGDVAPDQSPVFAGLVAPGTIVTFTASGGVRHQSGCPPICNGPDGGTFFDTGAADGISDLRAPINALIGVFLGSGQPDLNTAPAGLNFETLGTSFSTLSPLLQQAFFIGDGLTGTGTGSTQTFIAPPGASRLFLGTMDAFGWYNNTGSFDVLTLSVNPVPVPAGMWLFGSAVIGLGAWIGRRRRSAPAP